MLKKFTKRFFGEGSPAQPAQGFFLNVRCNACGEEFHLFINRSTDLAQEFDEKDGVTYSLNKEVLGSRCKNLIYVKMKFDGAKKMLSREIENGEFVEG